MIIHLSVPGVPVGKGRPRTRVVKLPDGRTLPTHYTPKKTRDYERTIALLAKAEMRRAGVTRHAIGGLRLQVVALFKRPASVSAKKRPMPTVKPDLDNVVKSVFDGLQQAEVFLDDAQVVEISASKVYVTGEPGLEIELSYAREG